MTGETALERDDAIDAMYQAIERSIERLEQEDAAADARAMVAAAVDELWKAGFVLAKAGATDEAPDWAEVLVSTLFTGAPLDFDGIVIPPWLQVRLENEYGHPYPNRPPTGQQQPPDLDDEPPNVPPVAIPNDSDIDHTYRGYA